MKGFGFKNLNFVGAIGIDMEGNWRNWLTQGRKLEELAYTRKEIGRELAYTRKKIGLHACKSGVC